MRERILRAPEISLAVGLAIVTTCLRLWLVRPLSFCGTPDACFYLGMAQNLATGHGFHARFLYDFQQARLTLPNTGLEYWRPGVSLLLLLTEPFGGVTLHSSIVLTILVGIVFAAAAWHIAMQAYGSRRLALASFALCLLSPSAWTGSVSPDSGIYYGAAVAWFLALFTVRRQGLLQDLLALGCVCIAYLVRNDAALLLLPLLAVLWQRRQQAARPSAGGKSGPTQGLIYAGGMLFGFLVALLPMHLLYHAVLGTAFPSGTAKALYLNDLSDIVRYDAPVSPHSLLAHGIGHLLLFRIATLATVVYRVAVLMIGYAGLVFLPALFLRAASLSPVPAGEAHAGFLRQGRLADAQRGLFPEMTGAVVFFLAALLAYTLILPAIGGFSALRTAEGVMPLADVLVIVAIARAARTPQLSAILAAAVIAANALGGLMEAKRGIPAMNAIGASDRVQARQLAELGADPATAVVMTGDPVQFSVTTGYAAVALPVNGLDAIAHAAQDLRATHVILNTEDLPATIDVLARQLPVVHSATLPAEHTLILKLSPEPIR